MAHIEERIIDCERSGVVSVVPTLQAINLGSRSIWPYQSPAVRLIHTESIN